MTSPIVWESFIQSYVMGATSPGFQFAKSLAPALSKNPWEIPLPVGVNTVQVSYSGSSSVTTDVRIPGKERVQPSRLQFKAGTGTRTAISEVPVSKPGTVITFTCMNVLQQEVGLPLLGVKIIPAPPAE